jgi:hypothetical protein
VLSFPARFDGVLRELRRDPGAPATDAIAAVLES